MNSINPVLAFAILWLVMDAVILGAYLAIIVFLVDPLCQWREHRRRRRQLVEDTACELARIERRGADSVARIERVFRMAQQLIRDEASTVRDDQHNVRRNAQYSRRNSS